MKLNMLDRLCGFVSGRVPYTGSQKRAADREKRAFVRVLETDWQGKAIKPERVTGHSLRYEVCRPQSSTA